MLKFRLYPWGLLLSGLIVAGTIAAAASLLPGHDSLSLEVTAVDVIKGPAGETRLLVKGEGFDERVQTALIPEIVAAETVSGSIDLALNLYQVATDGRLAVASSRGQRLLTIDVTAGRKPRVLGGIKLSQPASAIKPVGITALSLIGSKVVVSRNPVGLNLVDVSDPAEPQQVDFLQITERLIDMQADGERIYVASDTAGLLVVTLEDNRLVARRVPGSPLAARLTVARGRLVTATYKGDLAFYDLDPQGWPQLAGTLKLATSVRDLTLAHGNLFVSTAAGQLNEFNLDAWPRPVLAGTLDLKGRPLSLENQESSPQLLSIMVGSGVAAIDISRPGKPQLLGGVPFDKVPISAKSHGDRWFLSGLSGLRILSTPELVGELTPVRMNSSLLQESGKSFLLPWKSALFAYNHSNLQRISAGSAVLPETVTDNFEALPFLVLPDRDGVRLHAVREGLPTAEVIGRIPVYDELAATWYENDDKLVKKAFWQAGRVYALSPFKVSIFEVDSSGKVLSREQVDFSEQLADMTWHPAGFLVLAMATGDSGGLKVLDVRRPGGYRVVGEYPFAKHQRTVGAVKKLLVDGSRLYVARARLGVEIYDLANPAQPQLLQRIDTPGYAVGLTLYKGLLLVADKERGIFVIDVSGERAIEVGSYRLPTPCEEIFCNGSALYMTNNSGGIFRLPAPVWLPAAELVSEEQENLTVPSGTAPGRYRLALYDEEETVSYAVNIK